MMPATNTRNVNTQMLAWKKMCVVPRARSCFLATVSPTFTDGSCQKATFGQMSVPSSLSCPPRPKDCADVRALTA